MDGFIALFAQCSATMIGIIGAFIIAKILDEGNNFAETEIEFYDLCTEGRVLEAKAANFDSEKYKTIKEDPSLRDEFVKLKMKYEKIEAKYESHCAAQKSLRISVKEAKKEMVRIAYIIVVLMIGTLVLVGIPLGLTACSSNVSDCVPCNLRLLAMANGFLLIMMLIILVEALFTYFLIQVIHVSSDYKKLSGKFKDYYADKVKWNKLLDTPFDPDKKLKLRYVKD
jgi:hypothetical protein